MTLCRGLGAAALVLLAANACSSTPSQSDPEAFCRALRDASAEAGAIGTLDLGNTDSIEAALGDLEQLVQLAPENLADEVGLVTDVYGEVLNTLATTAPGLRDDALRELQPRLDEAATPALTLQNYAASDCRLRFDGPAEPTPTPTPLNLDD